MSKEDLIKFIRKVKDLNSLIRSLDEYPDRRDSLAACENHDQVVALAKYWGFEIGRRWGENDIE